ncbi:protein-L-isoaspartate(D-aspartate) O-methyltransferase [Aeropyrum camini]|uniref:Protein-L-isoaspartate O-methyltransferase n=1 Tax=Aeropyrum camini SY1 = JCM 12091 TaxID=1198449 RepID=U3TCK1_9CREN|nr:protein-L-isoaspartate(D-aspartate) O-methyltransferase [Aeropyrum camini]BAN90136.1 protein-L-isoaspartate O-methyltransferase [Aeropyrum camini SY1 = JCM 12091]
MKSPVPRAVLEPSTPPPTTGTSRRWTVLREGDPYREARLRMVEQLRRSGLVTSSRVLEAMARVPRHLFVPPEYRGMAYEDRPLPIGHGQTISAPGVVGRMLQLLDPRPGDRVLDVGAGSGYQSALLAELVSPGGRVYAVERIPELAEYARENLGRAGYLGVVEVVVGDGSRGLPQHAPYQRIKVAAAAPKPPKPLVEQLASGGRMVIPIGTPDLQVLTVIEKTPEGRVREWRDIEFLFVPLIGEHGYREDWRKQYWQWWR